MEIERTVSYAISFFIIGFLYETINKAAVIEYKQKLIRSAPAHPF